MADLKIISSLVILFFLGITFYLESNEQVTGAVVYAEDYRGIKVKFYDADKKEQCYEMLDLVPDEYLFGLQYIKILDESSGSFGHYHESFVLEIYGECEFLHIMHELAHHRQKMMGDSSYEITHHLGRFDQFEHEIFMEMQGAQGYTESEAGSEEAQEGAEGTESGEEGEETQEGSEGTASGIPKTGLALAQPANETSLKTGRAYIPSNSSARKTSEEYMKDDIIIIVRLLSSLVVLFLVIYISIYKMKRYY